MVNATVTPLAAAPKPFKKREPVERIFLTPVEISRIRPLKLPKGLKCVGKRHLGMPLTDSAILAGASHAIAEFPDARCKGAFITELCNPAKLRVHFPRKFKGVF